MPPQENDETAAVRLGRKLREARLQAGYRSQEAFGTAINLHRTTVNKLERGVRAIDVSVLKKWCEICGVDYELYESSARLAWSAESVPIPAWFEDFLKAQILSHTIWTWQPLIVPGHLQTADYARVLVEVTGTPDGLIDDRVAARMDLQQQTLERHPVPVSLLAVIDESVLHRKVGTPETMHAQLMHIVELGRRRNIGIQVVPASHGVNAGHVGAFTIAQMNDGDVMLQGGVEDVMIDKRPSVREGLALFDRIRLVALSGPESLKLIEKVAEEWT
ncbi:MAG: helix-turn-helix transcriptional regulator [Streptosporangiales bacterium]|jgi:transcriptional regulator with XRE-family HTH domain|nr:helix-turn-helix transcriptional regulator [Streptosporangiales bacterium]